MPHTKTPWHVGQGEEMRREVCERLLGRWAHLVKLGRRSFVFGEHDVDLRVGRNGNDHTAVGIEAHHLGVARRADILGQPLT